MSVHIDTREWVADTLCDMMDMNRRYTVDLPLLNKFKNHYVFVYGTLKAGCSRASALGVNRKNEFLGGAVTKSKELELVLSAHGGFPIALENTGNTTRYAPIRGQLWSVPTETILKLDAIESNGSMFFRETRLIHCGIHQVPAFMYIGVSNLWRQAQLLDLPIVEVNNKRYHVFNEGQADLILQAYAANEEAKDVSVH
jgi:gamma-glutamylcyclotransferase (GGCT)/AIG2-like uncharacterized protein YtfP